MNIDNNNLQCTILVDKDESASFKKRLEKNAPFKVEKILSQMNTSTLRFAIISKQATFVFVNVDNFPQDIHSLVQAVNNDKEHIKQRVAFIGYTISNNMYNIYRLGYDDGTRRIVQKSIMDKQTERWLKEDFPSQQAKKTYMNYMSKIKQQEDSQKKQKITQNLQQKLEKAQQEQEAKTSLVKKLQQEISQKQQSNEHLQEELKQSKQEQVTLKQQVKDITNQLHESQHQNIEKTNQKIKNQEILNNKLQTQINNMQKNKEQLTAQNQKLQKENQNLKNNNRQEAATKKQEKLSPKIEKKNSIDNTKNSKTGSPSNPTAKKNANSQTEPSMASSSSDNKVSPSSNANQRENEDNDEVSQLMNTLNQALNDGESVQVQRNNKIKLKDMKDQQPDNSVLQTDDDFETYAKNFPAQAKINPTYQAWKKKKERQKAQEAKQKQALREMNDEQFLNTDPIAEKTETQLDNMTAQMQKDISQKDKNNSVSESHNTNPNSAQIIDNHNNEISENKSIHEDDNNTSNSSNNSIDSQNLNENNTLSDKELSILQQMEDEKKENNESTHENQNQSSFLSSQKEQVEDVSQQNHSNDTDNEEQNISDSQNTNTDNNNISIMSPNSPIGAVNLGQRSLPNNNDNNSDSSDINDINEQENIPPYQKTAQLASDKSLDNSSTHDSQLVSPFESENDQKKVTTDDKTNVNANPKKGKFRNALSNIFHFGE